MVVSMSFVNFKKGDKAKILLPTSKYYNKDYYPVIAQNPTTGQVVLNTPGGPRVYHPIVLKKYVPPPPADHPVNGLTRPRPLPAPQASAEKPDEQRELADFFGRRNSDKTSSRCPLCGRSGRPMFNGFLCSNKACKNA
jgi:hypothetical protein